jgi:hypothetical protein
MPLWFWLKHSWRFLRMSKEEREIAIWLVGYYEHKMWADKMWYESLSETLKG